MLAAFVFAAMSLPLSAQTEAESLAFLYKNMSTPDSVDYPKSYWQKQVRMALKARSQMAWGRSVPRWEFEHFVLPVRVNNEALDDAREII